MHDHKRAKKKKKKKADLCSKISKFSSLDVKLFLSQERKKFTVSTLTHGFTEQEKQLFIFERRKEDIELFEMQLYYLTSGNETNFTVLSRRGHSPKTVL